MLPNSSLFHEETRVVKSTRARFTLFGKVCHDSFINFGKEGSVSQIVSKRKGRFPKWCCTGSVFRRIGVWSEWTLGRWRTVASSKRFCQLGLQKKRSRRSMTRPQSLLLVHVKRGPLNPRSNKLHASRQLWKAFVLLVLAGVELNFSCLDKMSLKSPATTQGALWVEAKFTKWSQNFKRVSKLGLA